MAKRLVEWGHDVNMVTAWREPIDKKGWFVTNESGINVHWLPVRYENQMNFYQRVKAFADFALKAAKKATSLKTDIIFATSTPLTIALPAIYASKRKKVPMVFEVRDLWPELPVAVGALRNPFLKYGAKQLELFAYHNAKRVIALSPGMKAGVESTGYPHEFICTIPNSSDLDLFQPDARQASLFREAHPELGNGPIVLYPGKLGEINGVEYMAQLAAKFEDHYNCKFVVIGSGKQWEYVKQIAIDLKIMSRNFFMYPQMPKQKLIQAFSAASVVLSSFIDLPEMEANSANKFFDALASGTAVAINYGGWQADILRKSCAGLVLPRDIKKAASILIDFLNDLDSLFEAGIAARKLAEKDFSRDMLAKKLESVLIDVVEN
jgi:glycosyltransferase involved in cell wall biosynthesis